MKKLALIGLFALCSVAYSAPASLTCPIDGQMMIMTGEIVAGAGGIFYVYRDGAGHTGMAK